MNGVQQFLFLELIVSGIVAVAWIGRGYTGNPVWWAPYGIAVDSLCLALLWGMNSTRPWQFWLISFAYFAGIFVNVYYLSAMHITRYKHGERAGSAIFVFLLIVFEMYLVSAAT